MFSFPSFSLFILTNVTFLSRAFSVFFCGSSRYWFPSAVSFFLPLHSSSLLLLYSFGFLSLKVSLYYIFSTPRSLVLTPLSWPPANNEVIPLRLLCSSVLPFSSPSVHTATTTITSTSAAAGTTGRLSRSYDPGFCSVKCVADDSRLCLFVDCYFHFWVDGSWFPRTWGKILLSLSFCL